MWRTKLSASCIGAAAGTPTVDRLALAASGRCGPGRIRSLFDGAFRGGPTNILAPTAIDPCNLPPALSHRRSFGVQGGLWRRGTTSRPLCAGAPFPDADRSAHKLMGWTTGSRKRNAGRITTGAREQGVFLGRNRRILSNEKGRISGSQTVQKTVQKTAFRDWAGTSAPTRIAWQQARLQSRFSAPAYGRGVRAKFSLLTLLAQQAGRQDLVDRG